MSDKDVALGDPTKGFFINMLTRDIELNDAILDLLDNCLDGVVRIRTTEKVQRNSPDFYKDFFANITITKDSFIIEDNCGGIPLDIAKHYAFRMGRDESSPKENSPTVGIYGIGMKRAIFKIGKSAVIKSVTNDDSFTVTIPKNWESQKDWNFPIERLPKDSSEKNGTRIKISNLNESIKSEWDDEGHLDIFVSNLIEHIKESYSLIIQRGFKVTVNGTNIVGIPISFVWSHDSRGIKPYVYQYNKDGVSVHVMVGFYTPPPTIDESDRMAESTPSKRSSEDAGWTIICNDRVILYNNKDHLTGWGENTVPRYHTQFIGIRGVVEFSSKEPQKLPMTTTKRGIDLASPLYATIKRRMCEGIKIFTNFTNDWKGTSTSETTYFKEAENVTVDEIINGKQDNSLHFVTTNDGGKQSKPILPKPKNNKADSIWIRFSARETECKLVSNYLYEAERSPSEIGLGCFQRVLKEAQKDNIL